MTTDNDNGRKALVLGGGGVAGIAWEYGLLKGLLDNGVDLTDADATVGTSAGSVVGATLLQGGLTAAFESQAVPVEVDESATSTFDVAALMGVFAQAVQNSSGPQEARAAIGEYARSVPDSTMPEELRIGMVASQLPSQDWPEQELRVTAVDATDGSFAVYDHTSGVELARAIMASCSVPGVGPTTRIDGRPFMDGGMRSGTNADVASDCGRILIIACNAEPAESGLGPSLPVAAAQLREHSDVLIIEADAASMAAFGTNPLLMSTRGPSADAGYQQGASVAERIRTFWA
jgi:NTE family protein